MLASVRAVAGRPQRGSFLEILCSTGTQTSSQEHHHQIRSAVAEGSPAVFAHVLPPRRRKI